MERNALPSRLHALILGAAASMVLAGCGGRGSSTNATPTITTQPTSTTAALGASVSFTVVAKSSGTLAYQWYKDGTAIADATSAKYTIASVTVDSAGSYDCVVSNGSLTTKSAVATLSVGSATGAPTITTQPQSVSAPIGGTATFNVVASGSDLGYQWYKGTAAISGATSAAYSVSPVASTSVGSYFVRVTNASGTVDSNAATLSLGTASAPTITTQPVSQTVAAGATVVLSVSAAGSGTLAYQWSKDGTAISGATKASYTIATANATRDGSYAVTVTNDLGSVTSNAATLVVESAPTITTQPTSQTVDPGDSVTFTAAASGDGLSYQWYRNNTAISGATSASYTIPSVTSSSAGSYSLLVSNVAGTVRSNAAALTVVGAPTITSQPASTTVGLGSTATFTVSATGSGSLTYQWTKNGAAISGATGTSYTTPATTTSDNGAAFQVVVSNSAGSTTSTTATLTVDQAPTITSQPTNVTVTHPATATFSVTATASGTLSYQWYSTTQGLISGATGSTYITPATTTSESGEQFYVKVYNDGLIATTSSYATLTVD